MATARVYSNEWYPGAQDRVPWSHYFPTLRACLRGLRDSGSRSPLRLQILKAVVPEGGDPVLLKFIIAPEYAVTASTLENTYGCGIRTFLSGFVGVSRNPRLKPSGAEWAAGNAIHADYRGAAQAHVRGAGAEDVGAAYLRAVAESWLDDLAHLVPVESAGPVKLHTRPVAARGGVLARCGEQWEAGRDVRLLQERLFYSPARGIAGKADRIAYSPGRIHLHEIKTGAAGERDPVTGRTVPGGVQAAAYYELMRTLGETPDGAYVELLEDDAWEEMPLGRHPVMGRARAQRRQVGWERYIDLLAQNRNLGYCLESGLLTGYDRTLLDAIGDRGRFPVQPPCRMCEANSRGVCAATLAPSPPIMHNFFRRLPDALWAYWVWFHRALGREAAASRTALYHLVTTPAAQLERAEGITVGGLEIRAEAGRRVALGRAARIDTRLREEDRVLLTPEDRLPGEVRSVEGVITAVGSNTIELRVSDLPEHAPGAQRYRVDRLGYWSHGSWQAEGLTDFLIRSVAETGVAGRPLTMADLPNLARRLLGDLPPAAPGGEAVKPAAGLNEEHRRAIGAALALASGDLLLVQGPPGTGKTGMVAHLVREIVHRRFFSEGPRPVLLLTNTHRAANELVLRLHKSFPDLRPYVVRVGTGRAGMEPEVRSHLLAERLDARARLEGADMAQDGPAILHRIAREGRLVLEHAAAFVGTLAAARAGELRGLEFEWVVVDEAGQATEPATLQALRHMADGYGSRLLLVGDHMQLPPVVPESTEGEDVPPPELADTGLRSGDGLKTSMFERLARRWPHTVLPLHRQYRMAAPICRLVSDTFYGGGLLPGTDEVAGRSLAETLERMGGTLPSGPTLDPACRVVFVDTSRDARAGEGRGAGEESRDNPFEARLAARLVWELSEYVPEAERPHLFAELGIISAYRRQNNLIRQELAKLLPDPDAARVDTVDRFQGESATRSSSAS